MVQDAARSRAWVRLGIATVAFGLLLGSVWASRGQGVFSSAFVPMNRVMSLVALLVLASMARRGTSLTMGGLALAGTLGYVVHAAAVLLAHWSDDAMVLVSLGIASTFSEGIAMACLELAVVRYALDWGPRVACMVTGAAFLVGQVYDCVFMGVPEGASVVQWLVGSFVAFALLDVLALREVRHGRGRWLPEQSATEGPQVARPSADLGELGALPAVMVFFVVVLLQYGLTQGLTGFGGIGDIAHYGMASGLVMVVVRAVVLGLCALPAGLPRGDVVVSCVVVSWVASTCVTLCLWGTSLEVAADWMRTAVYYALQVMPVAYAVQLAQRRAGDALPLIACGLAVSVSNQAMRLVAWLLGLDALAADASVLVVIMSCCLVATVAAASLAYAGIVWDGRRDMEEKAAARGGVATGAVAEGAAEAAESVLGDGISPLVRQEVEFARRFEATCDAYDVPPGERETLLQAVHGYTIDNIAANLGLSRETVKTNLSRSYVRTGVSGKQGFLALMNGASREA